MSQRQACAFDGHVRDWTQRALEGWSAVNLACLKIAPLVPPTIVLFDSRCTYTLEPSGDDSSFNAGEFSFKVSSMPNDGRITLPDGESVEIDLICFATNLPDGNLRFFMPLPEVWAMKAEASDTELLASMVFVHEFTHTQSGQFGEMIDALVKRGFPDDGDDDTLQLMFEERPGFKQAYQKELALLFESAGTPDHENAVTLAGQAMGAIDARRAQYFTGDDALWADAEDIFLTMEGTGQYAAYRWLLDRNGGALEASDALAFVRRDGAWWSQDEGLALLLVLERLSIDWSPHIFGKESRTVLAVMRDALKTA